ncbi:MAG: hypothetical protein ACM3PY_00530 [Omnitrophica WOR_2 bacterium]
MDAYRGVLSRLWLVVLLAILGGCAGWLFHRLQPPVYEAKAVFSANIDYAQIEKLTEYEQDQTISAVLALMGSTEVVDRVTEQARLQKLPIPALVYNQNMFLERRQSQLQMRYRNPDPKIAAAVVNLWAEAAYERLKEAHQHSVDAHILRNYIDVVKNYPLQSKDCPPAPLLNPPVPAICGADPPAQIQGNLKYLESRYTGELYNSFGVIEALNFSLSRRASVPATPVAYRQGALTLAGTFIGFLVGIFIANLRSSVQRRPVQDSVEVYD